MKRETGLRLGERQRENSIGASLKNPLEIWFRFVQNLHSYFVCVCVYVRFLKSDIKSLITLKKICLIYFLVGEKAALCDRHVGS